MRWKRPVLCLAAVVSAVWSGGCIMVMDVKQPYSHEHVVVLDGQVHVVNTKTNRIRPLDEDSETIEKMTIRTEVEQDDN